MDSTTAKQFLISKVIGEAELEHISLSEVEKKMLYFTESNPSFPDIYEVNAEFERTCDSDEYEMKISRLLRNAREVDRKESLLKEQQWKDALEALKNEDHYILVMAGEAFGWRPNLNNEKHRVRNKVIHVAAWIGAVLLVILKILWDARH